MHSAPKLTIELIPRTCWLSNVRSHVTKAEWDSIRKSVYRKAAYRCEICSGKGPEWPVECHEIFDFINETRTQTLVRLIALCPACHRVKHFGRSQVIGQEREAFFQLCKVNRWTQEVAEDYVNSQFALWEERSRYEWSVDLSLSLETFGITIQEEGTRERTQRADVFYHEKLIEHLFGPEPARIPKPVPTTRVVPPPAIPIAPILETHPPVVDHHVKTRPPGPFAWIRKILGWGA